MRTRLKELRMGRLIESQRKLADLISKKYGYTGRGNIISHATIAKIEQGKANPHWDEIVILSDFFNTSPNYLMGWDLLKEGSE